MASSLKSFCDTLAPLLVCSSAALYERQRALIRLGELPTPAGKGRGNGLAATPETVAVLLIGVMATAHTPDMELRVHRIAKARSRRRCKLTGKVFFVDALSSILASRRLADRVSRITVNRGEASARIWFFNRDEQEGLTTELVDRRGRDPDTTQFGRTADYPDRMEVEATLWNPVVEIIEHCLRTTTAEA